MPVCPTGASYKRAEDGIVLVDYDKCIGCKYCSWACPYGVREIDEQQKVMKKCTLCVDRIYDTALPEARAQAGLRAGLPDQRAPVRRHPRPGVGGLAGDPRERRLRADAGVGHAAGQPLPAAAQDARCTIHEDELERADNPLKIDGQLPKPAKSRAVARRRDVLVGAARRMHPAFSVIFLTTLIGAGQGLFLALFTAQLLRAVRPAAGAGRARVLRARQRCSRWRCSCGGLIASFFHLGHPERAWRSAAHVAHLVAVARGDRAAGVHGRRVPVRRRALARLAAGAGARCRRASRSTRRSCSASAGTLLAFALFLCTGDDLRLPARSCRSGRRPLTVVNYIAARRRLRLHAGRRVRRAARRRS